MVEDLLSFADYDEILPGVGAFPIRPSINIAGENSLRRFIEDRLAEKQMEDSRFNRMKSYMEMVIKEPARGKIQSQGEKSGDDGRLILGYLKGDRDIDYYNYLKNNDFFRVGGKFIFYFYAIKDDSVYSHHPDVFQVKRFCFYKNVIDDTSSYKIEPVLCKVDSNELISKKELVKRLADIGFETTESEHLADFYYMLNVEVIDDAFGEEEISFKSVNSQNGNDAFSPHSPKVINMKEG